MCKTPTNQTKKEPMAIQPTIKVREKGMGWFERITMFVDEICCMSYTTQQLLQETNDKLCANMCFSRTESFNHQDDDTLEVKKQEKSNSYPCWGKRSRRRKRNVVLPLHVVKEDSIYYSKSCEDLDDTKRNDDNKGDGNLNERLEDIDTQESRTKNSIKNEDDSERLRYCSTLFNGSPYDRRGTMCWDI